MYKCEKCGKEVIEKFGSGRFCSRTCANSKTHSVETKKKISESVKKNPAGFRAEGYLPKDNVGKRIWPKSICSICGVEMDSRNLASHIKKHNSLVKRTYLGYDTVILDITNKELDLYREKQQVCEICGKDRGTVNRITGDYNNLCTDHDHVTNKFRGLLCSVCNRQLGWYEKQKENIEKYLSKKI